MGAKSAIKRVWTPRNVVDAHVPRFDWTGEWGEAFGRPQSTGVWYVWGNSGHGKTTFVLMLIRKLADTGRVHFVSNEEGETSAALQDGFRRLGMTGVNRRVGVVAETLAELEARLSRGGTANYVVIDSLEMSGVTSAREVTALARRFRRKLFVVIGQADGGRNPSGHVGRDLLYQANQKIWVEGYRAISRGRSLGTRKYLTVWDEEARVYWADPTRKI
jgi:predicted ATP-dependent serine protease